MTEPTDITSAAQRVEDLTRRAHSARKPEPYTIESSLDSIIVRTDRLDERTNVHDLEHLLDYPRRSRGTATVYDPAHFADYAARLADSHTTVWGDEQHSRFTAVFNDHEDADLPGWRDHTAVLQLQDDPEWQAWLNTHGTMFGQQAFAEFLEDHAFAVIQPSPADFLEVATHFKAHKKADFDSKVNLVSGDIQLSYKEETTAQNVRSGEIEVPREFTIAIPPFLGMPPVEIRARLKWRIDDGQLAIGFRLDRPDLAKRAAFADIREMLATELADKATRQPYSVPVLLGSPPVSLR